MRRCPWLTTPGAILLGVLTLVTSGYGWYRVETGHFHTVVSCHVYRSGQLGRKYWTAYLQHYGIKSLLNLRGEHPGSRWHQKETRVVDALGVTH
jgi:hypothetical protein